MKNKVYCVQDYYTGEIFVFDSETNASLAGEDLGEHGDTVRANEAYVFETFDEYLQLVENRKIDKAIKKLSKEELGLLEKHFVKSQNVH